jgi:predicted transcriptional regulator
MVVLRRDLAMATTGQSVADVVTTDPVVLDSGASLEAADLVLRSTFIKGIPVIDDQGKLVGTSTHAHLAVHRFAEVDPTGGETGSAPSGRTD